MSGVLWGALVLLSLAGLALVLTGYLSFRIWREWKRLNDKEWRKLNDLEG